MAAGTALGPVCRAAAATPGLRAVSPARLSRPRIGDRIVFEKLVQVLRFGCPYEAIADSCCSATTIRARRDEWIAAGIFVQDAGVWLTIQRMP
jgi:transposase